MSDLRKAARFLWHWAARMIAALREPETGDDHAQDLEERVFHPRQTRQSPSLTEPTTRPCAKPRKVDA